MRRTIAMSLLAGTLLVSSAGVLQSANQTKTARQRCLVGLTFGEGVWVAGAYDPKSGWLEDEKSKARFTSGTRFSVYNRRAKVADLTIKKVEVGDGVGGYYAPATGKVADSKINRSFHTMNGQTLLALSGAARPLPRPPREQSLAAPLYRHAVAQLLRNKGLRTSQAKLTQHWRIDLNGDGVEEVLLAAHSRDVMGKEPRALKGDYAIVALRFVDKGKVKTVPLAVDAYTRARLDGALAAARFGLLGCYDIDGDGRMEIALSTGYYEGFGVAIFKFDGKNAKPVLAAGWGA